MKQNEYKIIKHKGNTIKRMKRHSKDNSRFLFYFKKDGKLYRKLYAAPNGTKGDMVDSAIEALGKLYETVGNIRRGIDPNIKMDDYWEKFIKNKGDDWSVAHKRTMKGFYKNHIKTYIGSIAVASVTLGDIDAVMLGVKSKSKRLQKGILEVLEPLFKKSVRDGLRTATPIDDDHQVTRNFSAEKKVILGAEDKFVSIYKAIHTVFKDDIKVRTAFLFGFGGRRLMEVLKMEWHEVDLVNKTYLIPKEKSKVDVDMIFSLGTELAGALTEMKKTRDSKWIFSSNRDASINLSKLSMHYDKIREASGIKDFTFHWMRNLYVSAMAAMGTDTADLSAQLGHQDVNTLKKYLSLQRESSGKRAEEKMKKLLPIK